MSKNFVFKGERWEKKSIKMCSENSEHTGVYFQNRSWQLSNKSYYRLIGFWGRIAVKWLNTYSTVISASAVEKN